MHTMIIEFHPRHKEINMYVDARGEVTSSIPEGFVGYRSLFASATLGYGLLGLSERYPSCNDEETIARMVYDTRSYPFGAIRPLYQSKVPNPDNGR